MFGPNNLRESSGAPGRPISGSVEAMADATGCRRRGPWRIEDQGFSGLRSRRKKPDLTAHGAPAIDPPVGISEKP